MSTKGIKRKIDELGRVTLPKQYRTVLNLQTGGIVEAMLTEGSILLTLAEMRCALCGNTKTLLAFEGKHICPACAAKIQKTNFAGTAKK